MTVDRSWVERNVGFDPIKTLAPPQTYASIQAGESKVEDSQREIIDFDSEGPEGSAFLAFSKATGMSRFTEIPWPKGLAPKPANSTAGGGARPLPRADILVVTWTVDEGHALSRVLTPGKDSRNDYSPYTHNFDALSSGMSRGSPAVKARRLGAFWTTEIGTRSVVILKSESHLSQDTDKRLPANGVLPNALFWKQIIAEVRPKLVITTGTGGGIGKELEVGDVIVSPVVRFDSRDWLKAAPFHDGHYTAKAVRSRHMRTAATLFKPNAGQLPPENKRLPKVVSVRPGDLGSSVVTTDFFGFDTSSNYYGLRGLGDLSEMGDAVLGMVAKDLRASAPNWVAVRNVSDPQIKSVGLDIEKQGRLAETIYKAYGRWSSVCSAIVCWALIAGL
jgi:hypothetical protein